ncbi:MAG: aminotransferase class III-fold pyridoxal phosphate-dependent enzyme, partial [Arenibacter sp.]
FDCTPDILVIGKGMAGGMPVGAFVAPHHMMQSLIENPKLGHITTFGGNPVIAAACLATLQEITESLLIQESLEKEVLFRKLLQHPSIKEIRGKGLMLALIMEKPEVANEVILKCAEKGLILFWLLFEPNAIRISPPLTISNQEISLGCALILEVLDGLKQ